LNDVYLAVNQITAHMKYLFLSFFAVFSFSETLQAQDDCPCCSSPYSLFDFWEGDWLVYDTAGTLIGENIIVKAEANCLLKEAWKGTQGGSGQSFNYYDSADSTWNQLWVSSFGNQLKLKGKGTDGVMIMRSELIPGQKIDFYRNQISWTLNEDGSVTQLWLILDSNDAILQESFEGIYRRR
jgi:hypothetical protein